MRLDNNATLVTTRATGNTIRKSAGIFSAAIYLHAHFEHKLLT
jgi:hypothetical protein